jgi:hypothetical protein
MEASSILQPVQLQVRIVVPQAQAAPLPQAPTPPALPQARALTPEQARAVGEQVRDQVREQIREQMREQLRRGDVEGAARAAQDAGRIASDAVQEALRDAGVQATPVNVQPDLPPWVNEGRLPSGVMDISIAFFVTCAVIAIGVPIARAFARRMDRKNATAALPADATARLERIEQAVDAIALEVERVSEGQRYSSKILSELRALPAPNPMDGAWGQNAREGEAIERRGDR